MILYNFIPVSNRVFFYTESLLIAVFKTEMVILLKYVLIFILTTDPRLATEVWTYKKTSMLPKHHSVQSKHKFRKLSHFITGGN